MSRWERASVLAAVPQLREQRGMSASDLSGVSRRSDGRKMSAQRIGRIETGGRQSDV